MKNYFTLLLSLSILCVVGQNNPAIQLDPNIDTIVVGTNYNFTLNGISTGNIQQAKFDGGTVDILDLGLNLYVDTIAQNGEKHKLQLYISKGGKTTLAFEKKFTLMPVDSMPGFASQGDKSPAVATYWGSMNTLLSATNTFSKAELQKENVLLYVVDKKEKCNIISFRLRITCADESKDYVTKGDRLIPDMLKAVREAKSGCNIMLWDVRYKRAGVTSNAEELVTGPFDITVK